MSSEERHPRGGSSLRPGRLLNESSGPPGWLESLALTPAFAVASVGSVGLGLAILGHYSSLIAVGLGLPLTVLAATAHHRGRGRAPVTGHARLGAAMALLLVAGFLVISAWAPSQHVLINRDPGSYTSTARWLAREGSLEVTGAVGGLDGIAPLSLNGYAVHDIGDGTLQFQFNHLTSVVLAAAFDLGGHRLMFRLPALTASAGLLVVYAFAVRLSGRPVLSLLAPALLGANMPYLYVARDTFSEAFAMLLLWSAALCMAQVAKAPRVGAAIAAGMLLGATVAVRADSLLYVALALPLVATWASRSGRSAPGPTSPERSPERSPVGRVVAGFVGAVAAGVALGLADLQWRSGRYLGVIESQVSWLRFLVVSSVAASGLLWWGLQRFPQGARRLRAAAYVAAPWAAAAVVVLLLLGWWVRPHVQQMRGADEVPLVEALQRSAGVPVEPDRRYGERSLEWMAWYLGPPALLTAIAGAGIAVRRVLRGTQGPLAVLAAALVVAALYWWRPTIVPDHVWAMRRFVPVVLPALALLATVALADLSSLRGGAGRVAALRRVAVGGLAVAMVAWAGSVTWPVRQLREQHGHLGILLEACEIVGPDASVVVVGEPSVHTLPQAIRSWCGVPAAALKGRADAAWIERLRSRVEAEGRVLAWVSADAAALAGLGFDGPGERTGSSAETRQAERTLLRPPGTYRPRGDGWSLTVVRAAGSGVQG
jgi:hypothetical protein